MDTLTLENIMLVTRAMGKMAYNLWPVLVLMVLYPFWEYWTQPRPARARTKNNNANRYRGKR